MMAMRIDKIFDFWFPLSVLSFDLYVG